MTRNSTRRSPQPGDTVTHSGTGGERWAELVELYEYRVADTLQERVPRGGQRSLAELREELLGAPLGSALHRRLKEADREYLAHRKSARLPQQPTPTAEPQTVLWDVPLDSESGESRAWQELHLLAWGDAAHATLRAYLPIWQREPSLLTLRVLYTALENAERAGQAGLSGQVSFPVPAVRDPLTDLDNPQVLQVLTEAVVALLVQPHGRGRLQLALSQIHEVPFPRHPDEDVLQARVEAAGRESLAPQARDTLIQALRTLHPAPRDRDPRERPAIREAARALARSLEPLLNSGPQATLGGVPQHSILYAAQPGTALEAPDDAASELVIRLPGGEGTHWRGTDFRWQSLGKQWQLQAGEQIALLRPRAEAAERGLTLELPHIRLRAFVSGEYLLLRAQSGPHEDLTRLISLGRVIAQLLDPADDYAALRLTRAAAQLLRAGRIDADSVSASSAASYAGAAPDALHNFARKGAEILCGLLVQRSTSGILQAMRDAARPLGLTGSLTAHLATALTVAAHHLETPPSVLHHSRVDLPQDGMALCAELRDSSPLTLHFGARAVTLRRDFCGQWTALLPGHPALILQDLTVTRGPGFSLILARHDGWLSAAAPPDGRVARRETRAVTTPQPACPKPGHRRHRQPEIDAPDDKTGLPPLLSRDLSKGIGMQGTSPEYSPLKAANGPPDHRKC